MSGAIQFVGSLAAICFLAETNHPGFAVAVIVLAAIVKRKG
jgi:hypothetical protein